MEQKRIKRLLKNYVEKNKFIEYEEFEDLVLGYQNMDYIRISKFYFLVKNIYKNIEDDKIILEKANKIYKLGGIKYLQCTLYVLYELLAKTKNYNILTYPRKLEFLFEEVTPDWQA